MSSQRTFIAAGTRERFMSYCSEHGLDPQEAIYVRSEQQLLGHRGGRLIVLPDYIGRDWQSMAMYARTHEIEVNIL